MQTVLHLASVALQCILEIFSYPFLQSCFILLKGYVVAACKISTGNSNAQPSLGATGRLRAKGVLESFLGMLIPEILHFTVNWTQ